MQKQKIALITGAAKRVGATIARSLHVQGIDIAIHYNSSAKEANNLCEDLNRLRPNSAITLQANLHDTTSLPDLVATTIKTFGQLDVLVNNASSFYPTPIGQITEEHWLDLMSTNLKAPLFLAQAAAPHLTKQRGSIINIVDIHARQPLKSYPLYCVAKAGLLMLTKVLAKELSPEVRVNAIAPGPILWSDEEKNELDSATQEKIIARTLLKRSGSPQDVANAVTFFIKDADYITGQVLAIDGGRSLNF